MNPVIWRVIADCAVEIMSKISEAAQMASHNSEICLRIQNGATRLHNVVLCLEHKTDFMGEVALQVVLLNIEGTLRRAFRLVWACQQRRGTVSCLFQANNLHADLLSVKQEISDCTEAIFLATSYFHLQMLMRFRRVNFSTLRVATNNFSNRIERNRFFTMYKGELHGNEITVRGHSEEQYTTYRATWDNEKYIVAKLLHTNILELVAWCYFLGQFYLVQESLHKGRLLDYIDVREKRWSLSWKRRFKIIQGIAHGASYLHSQRIMHLRLKPHSIHLDHDYTPKIGEFRMSKMLPRSTNEELVDPPRGASFMALEYVRSGKFSVKSDVYSFGILLLELITGQTHHQRSNGSTVDPLVAWVWKFWHMRRWDNCIDWELVDANKPKLQYKEIEKCIHIALLCVQRKSTLRPNMPTVCRFLRERSTAGWPDPAL